MGDPVIRLVGSQSSLISNLKPVAIAERQHGLALTDRQRIPSAKFSAVTAPPAIGQPRTQLTAVLSRRPSGLNNERRGGAGGAAWRQRGRPNRGGKLARGERRVGRWACVGERMAARRSRASGGGPGEG